LPLQLQFEANMGISGFPFGQFRYTLVAVVSAELAEFATRKNPL
jgi:hypothetical protein